MNRPHTPVNHAAFALWSSGLRIDPIPVTHPYLTGAGTIQEIQSGLTRGLGEVLSEHTYVCLDSGADVDTVRHFADGLLLAAPRYPEVWLSHVFVAPTEYSPDGEPYGAITETVWHGRNSCFSHTSSKIRLFRDWVSADPGVRRLWEARAQRIAQMDRGRPRGSIHPTGMGVHEFMHAAVGQLAHPEWKKAGVVPGYPHSLRDDVMHMVGQRLGIPACEVTQEHVGIVLGTYGATSLEELTVEAGNDDVLNGPEADPINQYIIRRADAAMQPFEPGPGAELRVWRGRNQTHELDAIEEYGRKPVTFPQRGTGSHAIKTPALPGEFAELVTAGFPTVRANAHQLRMAPATRKPACVSAPHAINRRLPELLHGPGAPANVNHRRGGPGNSAASGVSHGPAGSW